MRLIDADAEIARIRQEIQRIDAKIERLKKLIAKEPFNNLLKLYIAIAKYIETCKPPIFAGKKGQLGLPFLMEVQ